MPEGNSILHTLNYCGECDPENRIEHALTCPIILFMVAWANSSKTAQSNEELMNQNDLKYGVLPGSEQVLQCFKRKGETDQPGQIAIFGA